MSDLAEPLAIGRRGLMLVLSSPSGAGKTTLARRLLDAEPNVVMSVSVTTRPPRAGEVDGKDYRFIDRARFEEMRRGGELLESAVVFGNLYGTPRRPVEEWLAAGRDVLFDIDWQGTMQLAQRMRQDIVSVFILPPSAEELYARLLRRAQDPAAVVASRMAGARGEIGHWEEYDYVLVNDDLDRCERSLRAILDAERLKRVRRIGLADFVRRQQERLEALKGSAPLAP